MYYNLTKENNKKKSLYSLKIRMWYFSIKEW